MLLALARSLSSPFVVLLGAGASVPAGKPTIAELTTGFSTHLKSSKDEALIEAYGFVEKIIREREGKFDVELALQALTELTESTTTTIQYFHGNLLEEAKKLGPQFSKVKARLKDYIRQECEDPGDFYYLKPLPLGFMDEKLGLDIFTLNYDPTIEALCDSENISLTDGFDPSWNPASFDDERFSVRLYKVHGSVYWFLRSPGHYVKVPVKGSLQGVQYFTGEELSELVLYPVFEKKTDSGPYPFILNRFREKLGAARLLATVGYSFRDRNIRNLIIEQMRSNPQLWVLLASPNADLHREDLCKEAPELAIRIVSSGEEVERSITQRRLRERIQLLGNARIGEEGARADQARYSNIQETQWVQCSRDYRSLGHFSKLREIGRETLLDTNLTKSPNFMLERFFAPLALRFGIEDLADGRKQDSKKWLEYFRQLSAVADDQLVYNYQYIVADATAREKLKKDIGAPPANEREEWIRGAGISIPEFVGDIKRMASWFSAREVASQFKEVVRFLEALSSTTDLLNPQPRPGEPATESSSRILNTLTETLNKNAGGFYAIAGKLLNSIN